MYWYVESTKWTDFKMLDGMLANRLQNYLGRQNIYTTHCWSKDRDLFMSQGGTAGLNNLNGSV